ncbi:hypothetical protein ANN_19335 [Periplaneta americana]|uniref:Reverse transcriptase domain-containing protein n=1 Tax=Periplaneta americana TaxID=6978 RepID=A0ABQ8SA57_PERAM|nr:hypothetical protein ANN_19335 [Periplaneta americana]
MVRCVFSGTDLHSEKKPSFNIPSVATYVHMRGLQPEWTKSTSGLLANGNDDDIGGDKDDSDYDSDYDGDDEFVNDDEHYDDVDDNGGYDCDDDAYYDNDDDGNDYDDTNDYDDVDVGSDDVDYDNDMTMMLMIMLLMAMTLIMMTMIIIIMLIMMMVMIMMMLMIVMIMKTMMLLEKKWEYKGTVHQLVIDFQKAYDSVKREVLYNILNEFGIPKKLVRLIKMCLSETYRRVRIGQFVSDDFPIHCELKQGDALLCSNDKKVFAVRYIANVMNMARSTTHDAIKRYRETLEYTRRPGSGRPRATNPNEDRSTGFLNMCSHNVVSTGCNKSPLCILCYFKMNDVIDNPADCEVRSVIRFLNARHLKPAGIYR